MTNEEKEEMKALIARDKHYVKQLTAWRNKLVQVENDNEEHTLDQFKAFKEKVYCDNMIASINAQLGAYVNIVANIEKAQK